MATLKELRQLEQVARHCGTLAMVIRQEEDLEVTYKDETPGAHFSTKGDMDSQQLAKEMVLKAFPGITIIAEEQKNDPADLKKKRFIGIDPVDGTTNYRNDSNDFGFTLCLVEDGQLEAGVIFFPTDNVCYSALRGHGWFKNEKLQPPMHFDRPFSDAIIGTDIGKWTIYPVLQGLTDEGFPIHSRLAAITGFRELLEGIIGAYWNMNIAKFWDLAAGALIVQEAGGFVCDPWGNPITYDSLTADWVAAANPDMAARVIEHTKLWLGREQTMLGRPVIDWNIHNRLRNILGNWGLPSHPRLSFDAIFVAGRAQGDFERDEYDDGLLEFSASICRSATIVIPGHDGSYKDGERVPTGYPGYEAWKSHLSRLRGFPMTIKPCVVRPGHEHATHTPEECEGFVLLAKEQGWKRARFVSYPHQIVRLACCLHKAMEKIGYELMLVPASPLRVNWVRPVHGSRGLKQMPRIDQGAEEEKKYVEYLKNGWMSPFDVTADYFAEAMNELQSL